MCFGVTEEIVGHLAIIIETFHDLVPATSRRPIKCSHSFGNALIFAGKVREEQVTQLWKERETYDRMQAQSPHDAAVKLRHSIRYSRCDSQFLLAMECCLKDLFFDRMLPAIFQFVWRDELY